MKPANKALHTDDNFAAIHCRLSMKNGINSSLLIKNILQ